MNTITPQPSFFRQLQQLTLLIITSFIFSTASYAENIQVQHPRITPTIEGIAVTAVYFDILNRGDNAIKLVNVTGEISERIEIHHHTMVNGLMKMQKVSEGIELPAQETVAFKPGGYHIMVMNLQKAINKGDFVDLILHFDNGSSLTISAMAIKTSTHQHHSHN